MALANRTCAYGSTKGNICQVRYLKISKMPKTPPENLFKTNKYRCRRNNIFYITKHKDGKQYDEPRFLPFVRVQYSIALTAVNVKKYYRKMKYDTE